MSTELDDDDLTSAGIPELSPLGKRIELRRLERRMSKRTLAQRAGTSRQQLWRVMTGKSELTSSLCARLAEVLEIDGRALRDATVETSAPVHICETLEDYIAGPNGLERTFETFPITNDGRRLKRVLLDAIEDIAMARSLKLPQVIFDLRRAVVNDDGA
jgi:transcriptional regulator with XRE-family HTH domain